MTTIHPKVALIGANGMLATMLKQKIPTSCSVYEYDLPDLDIANHDQVINLFKKLRPDLIINCAAFTQVDLCESKEDIANQVNAVGPGNLANAAHQIGAVLVHISTDFVFSGEQASAYKEDDTTGPLSVYGRSKLQGERAIIDSSFSDYYIVRTSWLYGPGGGGFVETITRLASEREELTIVADQHGTPTYTGDLSEAILNLTGMKNSKKCPFGIYHFSNAGQCSWHEFACEIVEQLKQSGVPLKVQKVKSICTEDYPVPAKRPHYSVLSKEKYKNITGAYIPKWQDSLRTYFENDL